MTQTVVCTARVRDKNNHITAYKLQGANGDKVVVTPSYLKEAMKQGLFVSNLKLTSDGRLIKVGD